MTDIMRVGFDKAHNKKLVVDLDWRLHGAYLLTESQHVMLIKVVPICHLHIMRDIIMLL